MAGKLLLQLRLTQTASEQTKSAQQQRERQAQHTAGARIVGLCILANLFMPRSCILLPTCDSIIDARSAYELLWRQDLNAAARDNTDGTLSQGSQGLSFKTNNTLPASICRRPLRLVITSATLEGEKFSAYYGGCPVFNVPGRAFPVDVIYAQEDYTKDYVAAALDAALQIHLHQPPGDLLIFLTGQQVRRLQTCALDSRNHLRYKILVLSHQILI